MTLAKALHDLSIWKVVLIAVLLAVLFSCPSAHAHRSGCHAWHSCPSDRGTYECGDTGHCNQCPDNEYCSAGKPKSDGAPAKSKKRQTQEQ